MGGISVVLGLAGLFYYYISDPALPKIDRVEDYRSTAKVTTRILDRNGQLIGELFEERRTVVPFKEIPPSLLHAIVDAEDAQFFVHKGLNYWGILRAILNNLRPGAHWQGASSLTQQLVKNYILRNSEKTLRRKFQEMYLAIRLEQKLQKNDILWIYLNQISFGHQRFGVEEAAQYYFGKPVRELNLAESAVIASLPKAPEDFSRRLERLQDRKRYVLSQMVRYGHASEKEAKQAAEMPIEFVKENDPSSLAPEFIDEVEAQLLKRYSRAEIPYLGMTIRTTCDLNLQKVARDALEHGLQKMDERNHYREKIRHLEGRALTSFLKNLTEEYPEGPKLNRVLEGVIKQLLDGDGESGAGAVIDFGKTTGWLPLPKTKSRYNPKMLLPSQRFALGDVVRVRVIDEGKEGLILALEQGPQGAVVVIDPQTRHVLAMVGGYEYRRKQYNRAIRALRQPGSAFKPVLYAAAFQSKEYTPASLLDDSPQIFERPNAPPWIPRNAEEGEYLGPVRLRVALAKSLNTIAAQLIYALGPETVIRMGHLLGIESRLEKISSSGEVTPEDNLTLALGTSEVNLLELTNTYSTFAALGRKASPLFIIQVGDEPPARAEMEQAISPELAFQMNSLLQSVVEEGTARSIKDKFKRPVSGKTGTTNTVKDAWFLGYTPEIVTGVWIGFDQARPLGRKESGAKSALPIWAEVMQTALRGRPIQMYAPPPGVITVKIDPKTGKVAPPGGPSIEEVFLSGTEPVEQASPVEISGGDSGSFTDSKYTKPTFDSE